MKNAFKEINPAEKQVVTVSVDHSEEFLQSAKQLMDFISSLPIDQESNERLVGLLMEHVRTAEHDAVIIGFRSGVMYALKKNEEKWNQACMTVDKMIAKLSEYGTKLSKNVGKNTLCS